MDKYEVRFNVDRKSAGSIIVSANSTSQAVRVAEAQLKGMAGYAGKAVKATGAVKIK